MRTNWMEVLNNGKSHFAHLAIEEFRFHPVEQHSSSYSPMLLNLIQSNWRDFIEILSNWYCFDVLAFSMNLWELFDISGEKKKTSISTSAHPFFWLTQKIPLTCHFYTVSIPIVIFFHIFTIQSQFERCITVAKQNVEQQCLQWNQQRQKHIFSTNNSRNVFAIANFNQSVAQPFEQIANFVSIMETMGKNWLPKMGKKVCPSPRPMLSFFFPLFPFSLKWIENEESGKMDKTETDKINGSRMSFRSYNSLHSILFIALK